MEKYRLIFRVAKMLYKPQVLEEYRPAIMNIFDRYSNSIDNLYLGEERYVFADDTINCGFSLEIIDDKKTVDRVFRIRSIVRFQVIATINVPLEKINEIKVLFSLLSLNWLIGFRKSPTIRQTLKFFGNYYNENFLKLITKYNFLIK